MKYLPTASIPAAFITALAMFVLANVAPAQVTRPAAKPTGQDASAKQPANASDASEPEHPAGWVHLEEWMIWPLHKEPSKTLTDAGAMFRRGDTKKAAEELRKASSWMHLIDAHATVIGRYQLVKARKTIDKLAGDLEHGAVVDADQLAHGIAAAYYAIANEHYIKANQLHTGSVADDDSNGAAKHLIAAGLYLQQAGRSAQYEFGKDTDKTLKVLDAKGQEDGEVKEVTKNFVADHLKSIGDALQQLGAELQQP